MNRVRGALLASVAVLALSAVSVPMAQAQSSHLKGAGSGRPDSPLAHGCHDYVCITTNGSGLHLNYIFTDAENATNQAVVSHPLYLRNDVVVHTGPNITIAAHTKGSNTWNLNQNWNNGDVACVQWVGIRGEPCETIHS